MMKKWFSILLLLSFYGPLKAQDYCAYQQVFNRIDRDLSDSLPQQAMPRLDSVYKNYSFIYAQHCLKALQVCCLLGDSIRAAHWLEKGFLQGLPLWLLRNNGLSKKVMQYANCQSVLQAYNGLHTRYEASIDQALATSMDSLLTIDQRYTRRVNDGFVLWRYSIYYLQWRRNNRRQFAYLQALIVRKGFPGEQLLGLPAEVQDSALYYKKKMREGPYLGDLRAYIMLIHYYSNSHRDINALLLECLHKGQLPAQFYASLNDFMARFGSGKNAGYPYYNAWHTDPDTNHLSAINQRRQAIGLNTYQEQERNKAIARDQRGKNQAAWSVLLE